MKKATRPIETRSAGETGHSPPELRVIRGGALEEDEPAPLHSRRKNPRETLVKRARQRVDTGYYERPEIKRRLVDALWEEFYSR